jgi:FG-GAP-like repeat
LRNFWGFLLLSLGLISPCGAETFRNPRHIAIPSNPTTVGTADFNGDGRPDFYYTDANGLNVILANADGSYAAPQTTALGATNIGCRAADFNGDGFADAVCFTPGWAAVPLTAVFIGNGDGSLRPASTVQIPVFPPDQTHLLAWVGFADINSDGHLDILFEDSATGLLYTWFGDGTGQFAGLVSYPQPLPETLQNAMVADINGDGHPDIVFGYDPLVMFGVGDGTFTGAYTVGPWTGCHLADFDQDGHLDLFCTLENYKNNENYLEIHHGNPDGTFTKTPIFSKGYSNADFIQPFAARDLNGDGYLDILALSADGLVIFFGRPGVHFSAPVHYAFYNVGGFDEDQGDPSLIADYNLDGNLDLAMPGVNGVYITYGRADGTFDALPVVHSGLATGYSVVADFNEDGTPDIFTSGASALQLNLGRGNGTFAPSVTVQAPVQLPPQSYLQSAALLYEGDFNGDKHKDVIAVGPAADGTSLPHLFLGRGDGTFQKPVAIANFIGAFTSSYQGISVFDIDGDGRDDLVNETTDQNTGTSTLNVFLSNGDGTFTPMTTAVPAAGALASGDFNGDGKADLILTAQQAVQVLLGHGDGTFEGEPQTLPVPQLEGQPCIFGQGVVTGDFDHDGSTDFAIHCMHAFNPSPIGPTAIFVYYGHGDGTFSQPVTAAVLDRLYVNFTVSDLNGDGLSDFVLSTNELDGGFPDYRGSAISIVHSLPGRKFGPETNLIAGEGFYSIAAADFTGDGQPDLLFTNGNLADSLVLLTNIGTPAISLTSSANPSVIGKTVTFTATISAPADLTKLPGPGTITFEGLPDGNVSVPITFAGGGSKGPFKATATYEAAGLPVGSTLITAAFPGNTLLNAVSASLTQVVNPPSYQLVASPTTLAVKAGATANNSVGVTVKALYGFAGTVNLSCTVAYLGSGADASQPTCGFGTNPLPVKGADVSTQLILSTTAPTAADRKIAGNGGLGKTGIVLWGSVLLLLLPGRLRSRGLAAAIMILVVAGSLLALSSCGGTGGLPSTTGTLPPTSPLPPPVPGTQTANYSVTVSATSDTAAPTPPPVTVQLTVD